MPTSITFGYDSDFGQAETSSTNDKPFITWSMTGGNTFYTAGSSPGSLTVDSPTQFTIVLDRSSEIPSVADYTIEFTVNLMFNNQGTEVTMDEHVYRFDVNVAGLASSVVVSTASGLLLVPSEPQVAYGDDIVLQATIVADQKMSSIWVDDSEPIVVSSDGSDYIWPSNAVMSSVTSATSTSSTTVDIMLTNVPDSVFELGSVDVQIPVHYKDTSSNDLLVRRSLRGLKHDGEVHTTTLHAKVQFASDTTTIRSTSSGSAVSFVAFSTTVMAGAVLFFVC
jgi:hypothetical protein